MVDKDISTRSTAACVVSTATHTYVDSRSQINADAGVASTKRTGDKISFTVSRELGSGSRQGSMDCLLEVAFSFLVCSFRETV